MAADCRLQDCIQF